MAAVSAAREILRRLHEVMAAKTGAEAKMGQVVRIVADQLSSEVASIYLLRDGMLELYATHGLAQGAVHVTRLSMGQGLVGVIASRREPLNQIDRAGEFFLHPARPANSRQTQPGTRGPRPCLPASRRRMRRWTWRQLAR